MRLIIYAPHLDVVSHVHGKYIYEAGYHILPYFLQDWDRYKHLPLGALAHCTHVRGSGVMEGGRGEPNVKLTLASKVPPEECALNLGYMDPGRRSTRPTGRTARMKASSTWQGRRTAIQGEVRRNE